MHKYIYIYTYVIYHMTYDMCELWFAMETAGKIDVARSLKAFTPQTRRTTLVADKCLYNIHSYYLYICIYIYMYIYICISLSLYIYINTHMYV